MDYRNSYCDLLCQKRSDCPAQSLKNPPFLRTNLSFRSHCDQLSAFVWAPTWRIATVVKAKVTWVKTKNCPRLSSQTTIETNFIGNFLLTICTNM